MDDDYSKSLSFDEFRKGIREVGCRLTQEQEMELFRQFDRDGQGTINFEEFLRTIQVFCAVSFQSIIHVPN